MAPSQEWSSFGADIDYVIPLIQQDAIPGRTIAGRFKATRKGKYRVTYWELC